ncbi:MAG: glutamine--tRNA ligase, partial [Acidobacteria bacterium]|nr:glutamine--tRNA ligase [Acidobacteriota bacterium]
GGAPPDGRKVKATIHWVSAAHALPAEGRLYDRLLAVADPAEGGEGKDFKDYLNPRSLEVLTGCQVEPSLAQAAPGARCQFERLGYFCVDPDTTSAQLVFNRTVDLRDPWAKIEKAMRAKSEG